MAYIERGGGETREPKPLVVEPELTSVSYTGKFSFRSNVPMNLVKFKSVLHTAPQIESMIPTYLIPLDPERTVPETVVYHALLLSQGNPQLILRGLAKTLVYRAAARAKDIFSVIYGSILLQIRTVLGS